MIVKAVFTYELNVDIDSSNDSYVDVKALAKDLAAMDIQSKLDNNEITADLFDYRIESM